MKLSNPSYQGQCRVTIKKSNQALSSDGRILVTKKGWLLRLLLISCLVVLVFVSTLYLGVQNPREELIYIYSGFLISFSIVIYLVGWILYRNPSSPTYSFIDTNSNEKNPLVSVIVPIYNQKDMIESVIDAILNSTYDNVEIIAVNDGSIDGTKEILDSYEVRHPSSRLKIIHKKNGGKRKAVATGFLKSSGKYIVLIDSDSVIDKHAIKEFMNTFLSNPEIGAVAGHAKLLNAHRTFFTKCQDAWYDYEFNIYKACESFFGTVTCCCGCLAGYRREAIEDFMMFWHNSASQFTTSSTKAGASLSNSNTSRHNNRGKNMKARTRSYHQLQLISPKSVAKKATIITTPAYKFLPNVLACRFLILSLFNKFLKSVASYDDFEDRALTSYSIIRWKSVYVSSAIVYTEAPEDFRGFIRQQKRWKKGHTRANLFVSTFLWLRNRLHHLPLSLIFYIGFGITFVSPILMVATLTYGIFILHHFWSPIFLALGFVLIGFVEGLDYKLRDTNARYWMYRPILNLIQAFIISWLVFYALLSYRRNEWLTR